MTVTRLGNTCVVGLAWGDEGKGKIVDLLCAEHDVVVRFNGGANAGHTVRIGADQFALHLLPSGVLHPGKTSIIGPGVALDPDALLDEIDALTQRGIDPAADLHLSDRAHLVLPYHKIEDQLSESAADEHVRIGTTARGIGPCYADKMIRTHAIRACDLADPTRLRAKIAHVVAYKQAFLNAVYPGAPTLDAHSIADDLFAAAQRIKALICDTTALLHDRLAAGDRLLFEGANGTLLDVDHGTYPFVTSSSTTANGAASGSGLPAALIANVVGVTKSYATRVGQGPFVTELNNDIGDRIRQAGHEFGTTTGRPRRCGWFDAVAVAHSARLNGVTEIALMHLDTLSGFDQLAICTAYEIDGRRVHTLPASYETLNRAQPVLQMHPGWNGNLDEAESFDDLPKPAQKYVTAIENALGAPVTLIGVGPERSQVILVDRDDAGTALASFLSV